VVEQSLSNGEIKGLSLVSCCLAPGACTIKLITAVIYGFCNKLVFVPGNPFQPCLVFRDKHSNKLDLFKVNRFIISYLQREKDIQTD
jgi:hypothetical protein